MDDYKTLFWGIFGLATGIGYMMISSKGWIAGIFVSLFWTLQVLITKRIQNAKRR